MIYDKIMDVEQFNQSLNLIKENLNLTDEISFPNDIINTIYNTNNNTTEKIIYDNYLKNYMSSDYDSILPIFENKNITYIPSTYESFSSFPHAYEYHLPKLKTIYPKGLRDITAYMKKIYFPNLIKVYPHGLSVYMGDQLEEEREIHLPKVQILQGAALHGLQFKTIILPQIKQIESGSDMWLDTWCETFGYNRKLTHVILPNKTICCDIGMGAFKGTPIEDGEGFIYVPKILYSDYINDNNGYESCFRIIEDYPEVQKMIIEEAKKYG